jgi:hypothetical protein
VKTKIKAITALTPQELCKKLNEFGETHKVIATQTHKGDNWTAFVYFKEESQCTR